MRLRRREATSEQIDQAIRSFFAGFTASALTLAGAAECSLPEGEDVDDLFRVMKAAGNQRGLPEKEVVSRINEVRDWLKHRKPDLSEIDIQEEHAAIMILRAYTKFTSTFGDNATPTMRQFEEWFRGKYQDWLHPPR